MFSNLYPATIFCPENVVWLLPLLNIIFKCTSDEIFSLTQKIYTMIRLMPREQSGMLGSNLVWLHIVCNIGCLRT